MTWTWQIEGGQAAKAKSPRANLNVSCITDEGSVDQHRYVSVQNVAWNFWYNLVLDYISA